MKLHKIIFTILAIIYLCSINKQLFSMALETDAYYSTDTNEPIVEMTFNSIINVADPSDPIKIEPLNDTSLANLTVTDFLSRPMISDDFIYLSQKYLTYMQNLYTDSTWLYDTFPNKQIDKVLYEDIYNETSEEQIEPFIPYIAKLVVPQHTHTAIIGDIHGDPDTIKSLFLSLQKRGFIDAYLDIPNDSRIIFLGDYTDRGGFSMEVLRDILILVIKNPGQVFLLRGNHENIYSNVDDGILKEISAFEKDTKKQNTLIQNLVKIYEFTPIGMLLGFAGQEQTPFYFLAHGGPDIRYDYTDFLNLHAEEFTIKGGLCFWNLTEQDLFKTPKSQELLDVLHTQISSDLKITQALNSHIVKNLAWGFLWNDIDIALHKMPFPIYTNPRDEACLSLASWFTRYFLESLTNEYVKIVGLIRGHEHLLAKQVELVNDPQRLSSSCCYFLPPNPVGAILFPATPVTLTDTFSITTVISGPIMLEDTFINYRPTFLDLQLIGPDAWRFEAVE